MQALILIAITILTVWLVYLTWQIRKVLQLFNSLVRVKQGTLSEILTSVLKVQSASKSEFNEIYKEIERIDKEKVKYLQNISFVKYNPFGEGEFEQSFTMALLDATGTGVVITSIHTSNNARIYSKFVTRGRSEGELSPEEKKAIQKAMKV